MAASKFISFEEIAQGCPASVRVTEDMMLYAVDLVMTATSKPRDEAGMVIRRIPEKTFPSEKFATRSLPGKGNGKTKLLNFHDAIELIMVLPGKISKIYRKQMANIITRYLDGDLNLVTEIATNRRIGKIQSYSRFAQHVLFNVEKEEKPATFGYVYAFASPAFPGLIKIGRSIDVERRRSQLNTGCAPAPLVVIATAPSFDNLRDEKLAHEHFAALRNAGEFFQLSEENTKAYFESTISARFLKELRESTNAFNGLIF
jgi:hypothetical protein